MSREVGWKILHLVWWSKGVGGKEAPGLIQKACPNVEGLAYQTINTKVKEDRVAPPEVAEYVIDRMPVYEGCESRAEVVRLGVAAWLGRPLPEGTKPAEVAQALRAEFPADEVAAKLADALAKQGGPLDALRAKVEALLSGLASSVTGKLDALASAFSGALDALAAGVVGKLNALAWLMVSGFAALAAALVEIRSALDVVNRKLDRILAIVNDVDAKADVAAFDRGREEREHRSIIRTVWCVGGLVSLVVVGVHCQPTPTTSEAEALVRAALTSVLNMGKRTEERWIPKEPAPWQKLAKDCNPALGEEPINGGCWVPVDRSRAVPPCGELFRHGDICYRPVAADPTKPVGLFPDQR